MATYSAALLKVETLTADGDSAIINAKTVNATTLNTTNINADNFGFSNIVNSGTLTVTGASTLSSVTASGSLDVSGNTTLKNVNVTGATTLGGNLSVTGPLTTPAGFSVDTSSNVIIKNNLTLGTNSVVRSDGSGNFVVNGNVLATGSVVSNYNASYPLIDPAADWEGVWTSNSLSGGGNRGYLAFVKESNNTYTIYTNQGTGAPTGIFYTGLYQVLKRNVVPVFTKDLSGKVTANSITIPRSFGSGINMVLSRRLTTADIGSNFAFAPTTNLNGQNYEFMLFQRMMTPNQVTPVVGADWFSAYQSEYNEERINNATHVDVFDDVEGTYDTLKRRLLRGNNLIKTGIDVITGEKIPMNKLTPQPFIAESKFQDLKTDSDNYSLPINRVHFGVYSKPNVMTIHYDWKKENVPSPLGSPYQEMTIVDKANPFTPVIGTIPTSFKFLPSLFEHPGPKENTSGLKEPKEWFMDNFMGVRLPLVVSGGAKTLTITTTGPTSNFDVIPGVYTVTIPDNWVGYPHSLASYITQNISVNSGLRLDFYTKNRDLTNPNTFADSSYQSFFYLSSGNHTISSVSVTCNDTTFLTNVLGLNTLSTSQNPNAAPIPLTSSLPGVANNGAFQQGGFPKYTYNGNLVNINNLYTPQSLPTSITNLTINFSIGNVVNSNNPRDYYNTMFYFINLCETEEHGLLRYILTLADIDDEYYMPDTYEECIYKFVDLNAFSIIVLGLIPYSTLDAVPPGVFGKAMGNHFWNGVSVTTPFAGPATARNAAPVMANVTLEKYYKPNLVNNLYSAEAGYVVNNYLDPENTFVPAWRFESTTVDLRTQNMATYWLPKRIGGTLPAGVTATGPTAVPYSSILTDSSNLMFGIGQLFGVFYGLFKQSVANSILPPDASGSVCAYVYFGSYSGDNNTLVAFRDGMVPLFKSKGVKYIVHDVRGNPGGTANAIYTPYGLDTTYQWNNASPKGFLPAAWGSPNQTNYIYRTHTLMADILDNSGNYPEAWRYPVDSAGITITPASGGVDNTMYKLTGNPYYISVKGLRSGIGNNTVDGSNNGQGLLSFCYLTDSHSGSASKWQMYYYHTQDDANNIANTYQVGPLTPSPNTVYTTYGTYNRIYYSNVLSPTNFILPITTNPGNGGSLNQDTFYDNGYYALSFFNYDISGNYLGNSFNNPLLAYDALSNWSPLTLMTETGVYFDASGVQQAYTGAGKNAFSVSNDNINSYRDFRLERALQCAYAQREGCRAQPKFGYMPIDNGTSVKIVDASGVKQVYDPYNWNITDTTGALPLPVNPFDL